MKMPLEIPRDKIVVAEVARLREFRCVAEVAETVAEVAETSAPMLGIFKTSAGCFGEASELLPILQKATDDFVLRLQAWGISKMTLKKFTPFGNLLLHEITLISHWRQGSDR